LPANNEKSRPLVSKSPEKNEPCAGRKKKTTKSGNTVGGGTDHWEEDSGGPDDSEKWGMTGVVSECKKKFLNKRGRREMMAQMTKTNLETRRGLHVVRKKGTRVRTWKRAGTSQQGK